MANLEELSLKNDIIGPIFASVKFRPGSSVGRASPF